MAFRAGTRQARHIGIYKIFIRRMTALFYCRSIFVVLVMMSTREQKMKLLSDDMDGRTKRLPEMSDFRKSSFRCLIDPGKTCSVCKIKFELYV
jgi:hypothetical protein